MTEGDMGAVVRRLADEADVARVMLQYARGLDHREFDLVRACFAPGAQVEGSSFSGPVETYLPNLLEGVLRFGRTMHFVGNQWVEVDGDRARTESYAIAHHFVDAAGEVESIIMGVRYHDELARQPDGRWLITARHVDADWRRFGEPLSS
jgi:hypothetical protein